MYTIYIKKINIKYTIMHNNNTSLSDFFIQNSSTFTRIYYEEHEGYPMRNRNCIHFTGTCVHPFVFVVWNIGLVRVAHFSVWWVCFILFCFIFFLFFCTCQFGIASSFFSIVYWPILWYFVNHWIIPYTGTHLFCMNNLIFIFETWISWPFC